VTSVYRNTPFVIHKNILEDNIKIASKLVICKCEIGVNLFDYMSCALVNRAKDFHS
jgi:hypothetical protein